MMSIEKTITVASTLLAAVVCCAQPADRSIYFEDEFSLPEVVRFDSLPMRLFLRSEFQEPVAETFFPEKYLKRFLEILQGDYDDELHYQAARSLERIARERLSEPGGFVSVARDRLQSTDDINVRRACAMTLAEADSKEDAELLANYCRPNDPLLCALVEPKLAAWKAEAMRPTWENRIRNPRTAGRTLLSLAIDGAAALGAVEVAPELSKFAETDQTSFFTRQSAALALATILPDEAFSVAAKLSAGATTERIIAVTLLSAAESDPALQLLSQLCNDSENSIASLAWSELYDRDAERLLERLLAGSTHAEANVRKVVVQTAEKLPTADRCDLLNSMMGDVHIEVRNAARNSLQRLARSQEMLTDRILANAGDVVANAESTWQHLEQSMVLLAVLRHDTYVPDCVAHLRHDRAEVYVTAAWLLHLMPQNSIGEVSVAEAERKWDSLKKGAQNPLDIRPLGLQIGFLCHVAAYTDRKELSSVCEAQFSKATPLIVDSRAAALWTLGMLGRNGKDKGLRSRLTERVFDDDPMNPEFPEVKSASALAIGLLGDTDAVSDLRRAHTKYSIGGDLGRCVSTALTMLGEEVPAQPDPIPQAIDDWPIQFASP